MKHRMGWRRLASSPLTAAIWMVIVGGCGSSDSTVDAPEAGSCDSGKTQCAGVCVDLDKDPRYCGGCGVACDTGQVCSRGACVVACQSSLTNCGGSCVNLKADRESCGACGLTCAQGQVCSSGTCALSCQKGLVRCGDLCVDPLVDRENCGKCDVACASGQLCSNGSCAVSCQKELTNCDGMCVNLLTSPEHCGSCAVECGTGQVCSNGTCALSCQQGLTQCYGLCVNLQKDNAHCGGCDGLCKPGTLCSAGACAVSCQAGLSECGGTCTNLKTDGSNCGSCAAVCEAGKVCSEGSCELSCLSELTDCGGVCVSLATDRFNCGACGHECAAGNICASSACVVSCQQELTECGGLCVDLQKDSLNCGTCGHACPQGNVCSAGQCAVSCQATLTLCTPDGGPPYCANTQTDNDNCGSCGTQCAPGSACNGGSCAPTCGQGLLLCPAWSGFDAGVGPGELDASDEDAADAAPPTKMTCADPNTDDRNCGACGSLCSGEQSCVAGVCEHAASCLQLLQRKGPLPDGTYTLDPDNTGPLKPFAVYCHNMSLGTPEEYLTFAHSAATNEPDSNYVKVGGGGACGCPDAYKQFTRVRLDVATLTIVASDLTFTFLRTPSVSSCWQQSSGACKNAWITSPYGIAFDCVSSYSNTGQANVDLRDTPFSLDPSVVWNYWGASANGTSSINPERTVANVTGGGFCGTNVPSALLLKQN